MNRKTPYVLFVIMLCVVRDLSCTFIMMKTAIGNFFAERMTTSKKMLVKNITNIDSSVNELNDIAMNTTARRKSVNDDWEVYSEIEKS